MPDARLVARVRGGDEQAFEAVFDRYHRQLLAFCRHMLGNREEAEDAVQHVFVSAHRHLVSGDDRVVDLRPWLYAIARNRCLSLLRARRESVPLDDVPEPSADGLAVAQEVEQREDLKDVLADLTRLPEDQRAALVLSELGALSHEEVADVLGVRRDKVKALVFQARESLAGWRQARDTDCREIREQLATLTGGALRRGSLRKHLDTCDGCRMFRGEVRRQREAMALLLPVIPSVALKAKVVGAIAVGGNALPSAGLTAGAGLAGTAAVPAAGGSIAALGGGLVGKALVVAAIAGSAGGGYAVVKDQAGSSSTPAQRVVGATPASATASPTPSASSLAARADASAKGDNGTRGEKGARAKQAREKQAREGRGRPAVPGSNGFDNAPKARGLARRATAVPSRGAKAQRRGTAKSQADAGRSRGQDRRQQPPAASRPSKPAPKAKPPAAAAPVVGDPAAEDPVTIVETAEEPTGRVDRGKPDLDGIVGPPAV